MKTTLIIILTLGLLSCRQQSDKVEKLKSEGYQVFDSINIAIKTNCPLTRRPILETGYRQQRVNNKAFIFSCPDAYIDSNQRDIEIVKLQKNGGVIYNLKVFSFTPDTGTINGKINEMKGMLENIGITKTSIKNIDNVQWLTYFISDKEVAEAYTYNNKMSYYVSIQGTGVDIKKLDELLMNVRILTSED